MRMLIKIGGAALEEAPQRAAFARSVARALEEGHEVVVVHGGGRQLGRMCASLGLEEQRWRGLRVTDAQTAEVALAVLGGSVNRTTVRSFESAGVKAVGLSGADGSLFRAAPMISSEVELGYVGRIEEVDATLVEYLLGGQYVPVVATVGPRMGSDPLTVNGANEPFFNVNADHAAGALARAINADVLLLLTDVEALLDGNGRRMACATVDQIGELERAGTIAGGMLPKVEGAMAALAPPSRTLVKIAPGIGNNVVQRALLPSVGTVLLPDAEVVGRG